MVPLRQFDEAEAWMWLHKPVQMLWFSLWRTRYGRRVTAWAYCTSLGLL